MTASVRRAILARLATGEASVSELAEPFDMSQPAARRRHPVARALPPVLDITTPSDREIAMTRVFDAPRHLVFDAWTKPELLKRWLGVFGGWELAVCEVDLRVGGGYRFVWRRAGVPEMGMRGVYTVLKSPMEHGIRQSYDKLAELVAAG